MIQMLASIPLLAAMPAVDTVTATQDAAGKVTVTYNLASAPGVVTLGMETNSPAGWLPVKCVSTVYGDANKVLLKTGTRTAYWEAERDLPGVLLSDSARMTVTAWSLAEPPDYMVADLSIPTNLTFFAFVEALPGGSATNDMYKKEKLLMRRVHAANVVWSRGSPTYETGRNANKEELQSVMLSKDYYLGVYPVTQWQYVRVADSSKTFYNTKNPSRLLCPAENVSASAIRGAAWTRDNRAEPTASSALGRFSARTGIAFDLPTSAQWEFACRAGTISAWNDGSNSTNSTTDASLGRLGWYKGNCFEDPDFEGLSSRTTHAVGKKLPNAWGFYDMHGNVYELCLDWYALSLPAVGGVLVDPLGPAESSGDANMNGYVWRGGSYDENASCCRSAYTYNWGTSAIGVAGFRLCAPVEIEVCNEEESR